MIAALLLPGELAHDIVEQARAAYPNECCGLIEGVREGNAIRALALHVTRNLADAQDRFEIDPAEHIRLLRALRGTGRGIVGCYHSHPNGRAEPSPRDREGAGEDDFVWLIAGVGADGAVTQAAFVRSNGGFAKILLDSEYDARPSQPVAR